MKINKNIIIIVVVVAVLFMFMNVKKEAATTRTFSATTIQPGGTITITYSANNYFGVIQDVPSGWTANKAASPDGKIRTGADGGSTSIIFTAPSSGSATFNGQYFVYPDTTYTDFTPVTVTIQSNPICSCGEWSSGSCGGGSCSSTQRQKTRTCTPSGCDSESQCVSDASCGGSIGYTATRTFAKTTVNPGESVVATYHPEVYNYFSIVETVPNGWTANKAASPDGKIRTTADGSDITITWTAPSSTGSYTFNGEYSIYPDTAWTNFGANTITVSGTQQTCSQLSGDICAISESCPSEWLSSSDDRCCSTTCETTSLTCSDLGGTCKSNVCSEYDECTTVTATCSSGYCCEGACTTPEEPETQCLPYVQELKDGVCVWTESAKTILLIIGAIVALGFLKNLM